MKKKIIIFLWLMSINILHAENIQVAVHAQQTEKMKLGCLIVGQQDEYTKQVVSRLKKDLEYSGQCKLMVQSVSQLKKVSNLKKLFDEQLYLALVISKSEKGYEWRLYDTMSAEMNDGRRVFLSDASASIIAHTMADQIWPVLMGHESSFCSKIAYCKQVWKKKNGKEKPYKQIWIADFDGTNSKLFINIPAVIIAPRWGNNKKFPLLFYSENTLSNVQLVMSNMFGKRKVICCFDGLNMQPTFSENGKEIVFCLSKDGSSQLYHSIIDMKNKKRSVHKLTDNDGNNIAPAFISKNKIAFVSDHETHRPQLYIMDIYSRKQTRITDGGYCACPSYCEKNNKLVYSKMIEGALQLCSYDCETEKHIQLTKGPGSKEEPSWSACGNYILFGMNQGLQSRIAQFNVITGKIKYITSEKDHCTYPACSPVYDQPIGELNR